MSGAPSTGNIIYVFIYLFNVSDSTLTLWLKKFDSWQDFGFMSLLSQGLRIDISLEIMPFIFICNPVLYLILNKHYIFFPTQCALLFFIIPSFHGVSSWQLFLFPFSPAGLGGWRLQVTEM